MSWNRNAGLLAHTSPRLLAVLVYGRPHRPFARSITVIRAGRPAARPRSISYYVFSNIVVGAYFTTEND